MCAGLRCLFGSFGNKGGCTCDPWAAAAAGAAAPALKERLERLGRLLLRQLLLYGATDRRMGLVWSGRLVLLH